MQKQKNCGGLDLFRIAAALLVAAIHTSPLASFTETGDFFLTRVLARIAVPFFFMVTGQFTLSRQFTLSPQFTWPGQSAESVYPRVKKLCLLYGAAILLYLPLGAYAGHYRGLTFQKALRILLFDGAFYHLWYFPACITGVLLVSLLGRFCGLKGVTRLCVLLYTVGLLGDSYYGLTEKLPFLQKPYEAMFQVFSYTRNGLFFAPLFLVMGVRMGLRPQKNAASGRTTPAADKKLSSAKPTVLCGCGFAASLAAMTAEAFLLRQLGFQRHDSMYVFLIPTLYFLYRCLLAAPIPSRKSLRTVSALIYILHPLVIVAVRGAAKVLHLGGLLVDNSLLHYLAVAFVTTGAAFALALVWNCFSGRSLALGRLSGPNPTQNCRAGLPKDSPSRAWIELDMDALENNVRFLQSLVPKGCRLMPAVKANAYGHGADLIAKGLNRMGVDAFCVACADEGVSLRKAGVQGEILILGYTHPSQFPLLARCRLTQAVVDFPYAELLQKSGLPLHVHLAVDTGMHRLGIRCEDYEQIAAVYKMNRLCVDGIFTHLSACDAKDPASRAFTEGQIQAFYQVTDALKSQGLPCRGLHLLSSYGILQYPQEKTDYVRPGIALYGVLSAEEAPAPLKPVLSLKARVASVRTLYAGESAGYGIDFTAAQNMRIAALSIGYADGLPRILAQQGGMALLHGCAAPIVGRICMDQTLVDVSRIPQVQQGDTAVLIGKSDSLEITALQVAGQCGTITNELLSRLGSRLERI